MIEQPHKSRSSPRTAKGQWTSKIASDGKGLGVSPKIWNCCVPEIILTALFCRTLIFYKSVWQAPQNPNKRIWSFIGTGRAKNSRIDRIYVDCTQMISIGKITYIQTPFGGHRVLTFVKKSPNDHGKPYYKMNTSILSNKEHREIIEKLYHMFSIYCY